MFDVGLSELMMVGLVALLVIGPEKLPKVARFAGFWLSKTRSMVDSVKAEIKQEFHAEEMRQLIQHQLIADELKKTVIDSEAAIMDIDTAVVEALAEEKTFNTKTNLFKSGILHWTSKTVHIISLLSYKTCAQAPTAIVNRWGLFGLRMSGFWGFITTSSATVLGRFVLFFPSLKMRKTNGWY